MFIESLNFHLSVCSRADLPQIAKYDPDFWNVISMRSPAQPKIDPRGFLKIHTVMCDDIRNIRATDTDDKCGVPRKEHLQEVFRFIDGIAGEPVLIHCHYGVSRSTAVALSIIVRQMHYDGFSLDEIAREAPEMLLAIRPQAAPNPIILELGLAQFLPEQSVKLLLDGMSSHPRFNENQSGNS